ncbi:hypothetical protein SH449x_004651 [Pirellulaceae bacterium SH449]
MPIRLLNKDLSINAAIELHDSKLTSIDEDDELLVVELMAYLHQSDGSPGIDPGTVWMQSVRLTFLNGTMQCTLVEFPDTILDGCLTLSGEQFENCFAMPLKHDGPTVLSLDFANDIDLTVQADGLRVEYLGTPTFLEKFSP